jgi:hypothetical protein
MLLSFLNRSSKLLSVFTQTRWRFMPVLVVASLVAFGITVFAFSSVRAALSCVNDTAGANDEPGQKDLTQLCVDNAGLPTSLSVTWNWDEISVSGNNTLDACALFDTNGDGNVNFALCVTDPTDAPITLTLYTCGDAKNDRCTNPITSIPSFSSSCSTSTQNTDPFSAGAAFPQDRVAACSIVLADVGASNATLLDVCSYPSREPNSDPSDCVILQNNPTPTPTDTPTATPTDTPTATPTDTPTPTPTDTPTATPTDTPTATPTDTPTATPTDTPTPTPTDTPTATPTDTPTATPTDTPTPTPTDTPTATPTDTPTATPTDTPTPTPTNTSTPTPVPPSGQITPTGTTCTQFNSGTATTLSQLQYAVKNGKVSAVSPGVFFYWIKVDATSGSNTFTINQAITTGNFDSHFFSQASGSFVYTSGCTKISANISTSNGVTTVTFNASSAGTFIIGIKYDSKSVQGFPAPSPTTVHYDFSTAGVPGSTQGLNLVKK